MGQHEKLAKYLKKIGAVYNIERIIQTPVDVKRVADYYTQSQLGYTVFHSMGGAVHMALSEDDKFRRRDYYAQPEFISQYLKDKSKIHILEVASGKGFNTVYLAQRHQHQFTGVDLTPVHVDLAQRKVEERNLPNAQFQQGDFHCLDSSIGQFDCAFEVESICHALDLKQALKSIHRVLKPDAEFILFDCFKKRCDDLTPDEITATQLIEKSMSVNRFAPLDEFLQAAEEIGFEVIEIDDISKTTMPNLKRFELLGRCFFQFSILGKLLRWLLPEHLAQNSIAGLLMPLASQDNILGYYRIILKRQ